MARRLPSKPRYKISYRARSKIWFTKDSRLRRFFSIRGRQLVRRRRLFTRAVLVANKIKWVVARRFIRPYTRVKSGRSRRLSYTHNFYAKQQFRAFFGKVEENSLRSLVKANKHVTTKRSKAFYSSLETRLDVILYRRRVLPTIFACNQYIRMQGIFLAEGVSYEPHNSIRPGTLRSFTPKAWSLVYDHRLTRVFYRLYGTWVMRKRQRRIFAKKFRWLTYSIRRARSPYYALRRWAQLTRRFKFLLKVRINPLRDWRDVFLRLDRGNSSKREDFFAKFNLVEFLRVKIERDLRQQGRSLSRLLASRYFSGASFKNFLSNQVIAYTYTYVISQRRVNLIYRLSMAEQFFYEGIILNGVSPAEESLAPETLLKDLHSLLGQRRFLLSQRLGVDSVQVKLQTSLLLRQQSGNDLSPSVESIAGGIKPTQQQRLPSVSYFLLHQRRKMRRQRRLPRLKKVHWHVPAYRHFDARTLQIAIIRYPQAVELSYPFRCSIPKILSFYKSRGF